MILTGNNGRTVAAIAGSLGMEFRADLMLEGKLFRKTAVNGCEMISDAENDSPALKQESVWTCRVFVPPQVLVYATLRSKVTGLSLQELIFTLRNTSERTSIRSSSGRWDDPTAIGSQKKCRGQIPDDQARKADARAYANRAHAPNVGAVVHPSI